MQSLKESLKLNVENSRILFRERMEIKPKVQKNDYFEPKLFVPT